MGGPDKNPGQTASSASPASSAQIGAAGRGVRHEHSDEHRYKAAQDVNRSLGEGAPGLLGIGPLNSASILNSVPTLPARLVGRTFLSGMSADHVAKPDSGSGISLADDPGRPLRVLHYLPVFRFEQGGPIRAVTDLSRALLARGHEVTIATYDDTDWPEDWRSPPPGGRSATLLKLPPPGLPGGFFSPAQLQAIEPCLEKFDALHLHLVWCSSNLQLAAVARSHNVPYFLSLRGTLDDWSMSQRSFKKRLFLSLAGRQMLEKADAVHCTADAELAQSKKWFPVGHAAVIPNLMDLDPFRKLPGPELARRKFNIPDDGVPLLLFLSRVHEKKGVDVLLRAAGLLRERGVPFRMAIAGGGAEEYVQKNRALKRELKLQDSVQFVGHVAGAEKLSLYEASDLFILPTSQENFGFVFFESLACGTPVITTPLVDTAPDLEASGGAVLVDQNPEAFAGAIGRLLEDHDLRNQMSRRGREWTFRELDPEKIVLEFERMYRGHAEH